MPAPYPPPSTGLLTTGQVARMVGKTRHTIDNWIHAGKVECVVYPDPHTHARIDVAEAMRLVEESKEP